MVQTRNLVWLLKNITRHNLHLHLLSTSQHQKPGTVVKISAIAGNINLQMVKICTREVSLVYKSPAHTWLYVSLLDRPKSGHLFIVYLCPVVILEADHRCPGSISDTDKHTGLNHRPSANQRMSSSHEIIRHHISEGETNLTTRPRRMSVKGYCL